MKLTTNLLIIACVFSLGAVLFTKSCNKWDLIPSNTIDTVIESVYAEKKLVVATIVFIPSNVKYTEHLRYDEWEIPWVGSRGFRLDPKGKINIGLGYDFIKKQKMATVLKAERKNDAIKLLIEVEFPQAVTMDCRADIQWSWSVWTGQPSQDFAYGMIEKELFEKANQHAFQNPDVTSFAQQMCAEWYTTALLSAGFTSVTVEFRTRAPRVEGGELFPEPFIFDWKRDSTVVVTDEEAAKILEQTPGNIVNKVWEYFE